MLPGISLGMLPSRPPTGSGWPPCSTQSKLFYVQAVSFVDRATPKETVVSMTHNVPQACPWYLGYFDSSVHCPALSLWPLLIWYSGGQVSAPG